MNWTWGTPANTGDWPAREYTYVCDDRSLLLPWLMRLAVRPLAKVTPLSISPNDLTIAGFLASLAPFLGPGPLATIGLATYLVLDHLDGLHARRRGTSSPLGEFLDHWLDAWNAGLIPLALGLAFHLPTRTLTLFVSLSVLAFVATLSEHRHTGVLRLDRIGSIEAVATTAIIYAASAIWGTATLWPAAQALGMAALIGMAITIVRRARYLQDCLPVILTAAVVLIWNPPLGALIVTSSGVLASGRTILGRLLHKTLPSDAAGPAAAALGAALQAGAPAVLALLITRITADTRQALRLMHPFLEDGELLARLQRR